MPEIAYQNPFKTWEKGLDVLNFPNHWIFEYPKGYFWATPPEAPWMLHLNPEFLASPWCALSSPKPTRLATFVPCANLTRPSRPNKRRNSRRCQRPKNLHERAPSPQKIWWIQIPIISLRDSNSSQKFWLISAGNHLMATIGYS